MGKTRYLALGAVASVMLLASVALLVASAITWDWSWFQRSGSLLVVVGVGLTFRRLLRLGVWGYYIDEGTTNGGHMVPTAEEKEKDEQELADVRAAKHGMLLAAVGTLIWGWGDLLGEVLSWVGRMWQRGS